MSGDTCVLCSDNIFITILASLLWSVLLIWFFSGLSILADGYVEKSLDKMGQYFKIPDNVSAAIFLAFGSAVPEIMTNTVSTIKGKVDASLPAILGSGCIAYAVIPPICCIAIQPFFMSVAARTAAPKGSDLAKHYQKDRVHVPSAMQRRGSEAGRARLNSVSDLTSGILERTFSPSAGGQASPTRTRSASDASRKKVLKDNVDIWDFLPLRLATKPLIRDVVTYVIALGCTILFIQDTQFELYESLIMVLLYVTYIFVLWHFQEFWGDSDEKSDADEAEGDEKDPLLKTGGSDGDYTQTKSETFPIGKHRRSAVMDPSPFVRKEIYTYLTKNQQD